MVISDKIAEELVEIIIDFATGIPEITKMNRFSTIKLKASEGLFKTAIKENKEKYEEFLKRFHYWLELNKIEISIPNIELENDNQNK